jgi:hypothetical protein
MPLNDRIDVFSVTQFLGGSPLNNKKVSETTLEVLQQWTAPDKRFVENLKPKFLISPSSVVVVNNCISPFPHLTYNARTLLRSHVPIAQYANTFIAQTFVAFCTLSSG